MIVSLGVVALNEQTYLPKVLDDIINQTYPHDKMEILLVDSGSTDQTLQIMHDFKESHPEFYNVQILENKKRKQASGWNVAINHFTGEVLMRIDAHGRIVDDFVLENVRLLEDGENMTGGPRGSLIIEPTPWKETLLLAEESMFGSGIAVYRRSDEKRYVNSLFHGAYKREIFDTVGGFNENLGRTEDNEMHYRIREAGYKICYSPTIKSWQYARSDLKSMIKQKYGNGYWVARTLFKCQGCLSIYHFVPFAFVMGIIFTTILAMFGYPLLAELMWVSYAIVAVLMSVLSVKGKKKYPQMILLPFLFLILHVSYGIGSVVGFGKSALNKIN